MRWFYHQLGLCGCKQLKLALGNLSQRRKRKRRGRRKKEAEGKWGRVHWQDSWQLTEWIEGQGLESQAWDRKQRGLGGLAEKTVRLFHLGSIKEVNESPKFCSILMSSFKS